MSDFNEVNHEPKIRVGHTIAKAWSMIKGFKGSAWGGFAFVILVFLGITMAVGIIMLIVGLAIGISPGTDPNSLSGGSSALLNSLNFIFTLGTNFFIIPIAVGLNLLAVHRLKGKDFTAYRVFDYLKWRFMWRFFVVLLVNYLLILIIALIAGLVLVPMAAMHGGEPTITAGLIITGSVLGIIFLFALFYIGTALHFTNMLIAEKEMPLAHALSVGFKGVTKHFFGLLGVLILTVLIVIALEAVAVLIVYLFGLVHLTALGGFLAFCGFIVAFIWLLPWILNIWALLYSKIYGLDEPAQETHENITDQNTDQ